MINLLAKTHDYVCIIVEIYLMVFVWWFLLEENSAVIDNSKENKSIRTDASHVQPAASNVK